MKLLRLPLVFALGLIWGSTLSPEAADPVNQTPGSKAFTNRPLYGGANISMLVDGNRQASFHGNVDIEAGFAYEVNLMIPVKISSIDIIARQDGCCPERLTNYRVSVHRDNNGQIGDKVWSADLHVDGSNPGSTAGSKDTLTAALDPAGVFEGQWIRIESLEDPVQNYALQMTEIEVFGTGPLLVSLASEPQDATSAPGRTVTFSVGAIAKNGDANLLTYQWKRNGEVIPGATQASYTTPPLSTGDQGAKYQVVVSYPGHADISSREAVVGKFNYALGAQAFSNQPLWRPGGWNISQLTDGNRSGVFHGDTEIPAGFAYEVNLGIPVRMESIEVIARQDGCCPERLTNYRVSVHRDNNGAIGEAVWSADLHTDGTNPGSAPGAKDVLTKDLNPAGQFEGQWIRIQTLEDPVQNYALQMTELEVYGTLAPEVRLVLNSHPQDVVTAPGRTATLTVGATVFNGDFTQISYQWQKNGENIPGATQASYTTPPITSADEGARFRVLVGYPGKPTLTSNEAVVQPLNWANGAKTYTNRPLWIPGNWNIGQLVDGNRQGVFHGDVDIEPGFAYDVDLGTSVKIDRIVIFARQDGCCPERLTNFRVTVHPDDGGKAGQPVWTADRFTDGTNPGSAQGAVDTLTRDLHPQGKFEGQWIRIESLEDPVQNYALQMTELEVYGSGEIALPLTLVIARSGAEVELRWAAGVLESSEILPGSWVPVPNATSPLKITPSGGTRFYRLRR